MNASAQRKDLDEIDGPAVVTPLHVRDRETSPVAGAPRAWRKWSPLEAAYEGGKLQGGSPKYGPLDRFNAGKRYEGIFDAAQSPGRDSTQALNISRGSGGLPISIAQAEAVKALAAIHARLGERDRIIVRMVCGEGHFPSEAVAMVSPDYAKATTARFREALDALIEAFERKAPRETS